MDKKAALLATVALFVTALVVFIIAWAPNVVLPALIIGCIWYLFYINFTDW